MADPQIDADIVPIELATFTFADDEPNAGREGVVMGYVIRHSSGAVLFDTGFGFGSQEVDERYRPRARRVIEALDKAGIRGTEITHVVNCHLHIDHAGQNSAFPGVPIYVQPDEWHVAHTTDHTILEWIDFPGGEYVQRGGDYELVPGIEVISTPGHTPGHQSLLVHSHVGAVVLAGQAVYSAGEWRGDPNALEGRSRAPDPAAYDRSVARLRSRDPLAVYFAHDQAVWRR